MLYPKNIELKLGFDKIRQLLAEFCYGELGQTELNKMSFCSDLPTIRSRLLETVELKEFRTRDVKLTLDGFINVSEYVSASQIEGNFLQEDELFDIKSFVGCVIDWCKTIKLKGPDLEHLNALASDVTLDPGLWSTLDKFINERGELRDNASARLHKLRKGIINQKSKLRKNLESIFKIATKDKLVPEGGAITIRSGRMVIPIKSEKRKGIKGFLHDHSSSGQTVYIEPESVLETNNMIRDLENQEKSEVIRILTDITSLIRDCSTEMIEAIGFLSKIDFLNARVKLANELNGAMPDIDERESMDWKDAKHPLLLLSLRSSKKNLIPLNIYFKPDLRIILISGPNAGGKSVALKTVGLLQYMIQCGLLVPVDKDSRFMVFSDLFVDIGDEQSIENDLSTYSSHLLNMKKVVEHSGSGSMVLIDELGSGTEPQFGGAISEAILEKLTDKKIFGVVTTHYLNLKQFADRAHNISNAAMLYDTDNMNPLYKLEIGRPGSSFAIEIARNIGMPSAIIEKAVNILGSDKMDLDNLINSLENEKRILESEKQGIDEQSKTVKLLKKKYNQLLEEIKTAKLEILGTARSEAKRIIENSNREIEKTIRQIKEVKAEKQDTKKARERLSRLKEKLSTEIGKEGPSKIQSADLEVIKSGDLVQLYDNPIQGEVLRVKGDQAHVLIGHLKSWVKLGKIKKVGHSKSGELKQRSTLRKSNIDLNQKLVNFKTELDIRGSRAEEAIIEVDKFLDDAILFSQNRVRILHGKGNGILREVVRNHLNTFSQVFNIRDEDLDKGGSGITIADLK